MLAVGVSSLMMVGLVITMVQASRQAMQSSQKTAALEVTRAVTAALSDSANCTALIEQVSGTTFNPAQLNGPNAPLFNFPYVPLAATSAASISMKAIEVSSVKPATVYSNSLFVTGIRLGDFACTPNPGANSSGCSADANIIKANLIIDFDKDRLMMPLATRKFPIMLQAQGAAANKTFRGCASSVCAAETIWGCQLPKTVSQTRTTGSCTSSGSCSYTCNKGKWVSPSDNSCTP